MKKLLVAFVAVMACFQAFAEDAVTAEPEVKASEEKAWSLSITAEYKTGYMSDGFMLNPDDMLFGDIYFEYALAENYGYYLDLWIAHDMNRYNKCDRIDNEPEELDYTAGVYYKLADVIGDKGLKFDLSYTYWDMPERTGWNRRGCTKMKAALDISTDKYNVCKGFTVTPGIMVANDFENDEWEAKVYAATCYKINDKLSLKNKAELFWMNGHWLYGRRNEGGAKAAGIYQTSCLSTFVLSADLSYLVYKNEEKGYEVTCGPLAKLAWALDNNVRDSWKGKDRAPNAESGCNFLAGFAVNASF